MIRIGKKEEVDPVIQANQYLQLMDIMENAGYEHYEISSFALPGKRSRHNSSYWSGDKYFGFGPSAHSFDGKHRKWNIANNISYINSLAKNEIPFETEELTATMKMNEYIMTSLRTSTGLDFQHFKSEWGQEEVEKLKQQLQHYILKEQVWVTESNAVLTKEGKLFADGIASALFRI